MAFRWVQSKAAQTIALQMARRGWTDEQIEEAVNYGLKYPAVNQLFPDHGATRFVHPVTGRSVVLDDTTLEVLHVGGDGFLY